MNEEIKRLPENKRFRILIKCLLVFLIAFSITEVVPAQTQSNTKISISQKSTPLRNVLKLIENQSGFSFMYSSDIVNLDQRITLSFNFRKLC